MKRRSLIEWLLPFGVGKKTRGNTRGSILQARLRPGLGRKGLAKPQATNEVHGAMRGRRSIRAQERYDELVEVMKAKYEIRVKRWRRSMTGCAWVMTERRSGEETRFIEAPYPKGPMSAAIFLHEIGHHALGLGRITPRCLEEYHAWRWAIETMREQGIAVTAGVEKRRRDSLRYAVDKAARRGLRDLPVELMPYVGAAVARRIC